MDVAGFDVKRGTDLQRLIRAYAFKPLLHYGVAAETLDAFLLAELTKSATDDSLLLGAETGGVLRGIGCLSGFPWQSGIYGLKMAKISTLMARGDYGERRATYAALLGEILTASRTEGYVHLSCQVPLEEIALTHALEAEGFELMDSTIEYGWKVARIDISEPEPPLVVRPAVESDLAPMRELAREAFTTRTTTRYSLDPALAIAATGELYAQWLENSYSGSFADVLLVAAEGDTPIGFVTLGREKALAEKTEVQIATYGIGAVDLRHQAKGTFLSLIFGGLRWCSERDIAFARTRVLLNNYAVQRSATKSGAVNMCAFHTFHRSM